MKALKALVAGMGILIVVGIALVGYALSRGKQQPHPASVAELQSFDATVAVPRGGKLEQVTTAGDRIVLRFSSPEGDKLVMLDARTGQPAGTIALVPDRN